MPWRSTHIKKGSHGKCWFFYSKVVSYKRKPDHRYHFLLSENEPKEKTQQTGEDLSLAYELYHMYVLFDGKTGIDLFLAEKKPNEIIVTCRLPSLKEFKDPADTLEHRKKEIVNSFFLAREKRINNGPVKGRISLIKKIFRINNSHSYFERFRYRLLYSQGKNSQHGFELRKSSDERLKQMKRDPLLPCFGG
ncbi:MAG: transposase [Lachnospiraceae bacterium]|nr:transposase [Lachnospiraceae bacterium]